MPHNVETYINFDTSHDIPFEQKYKWFACMST